MDRRVVYVVTNVDRYEDGAPTGLWLSELTHAWDHFAERGLDQRIISPVGGRSPLEPRALKWPLLDRSATPGCVILDRWRDWRGRSDPKTSIRWTATCSSSRAVTG